MPRSRDELRQAVAGGEWLRVGDLAIALDISLRTAHRRLDDGTVGWKRRPAGRQRYADPADVLRLLAEAEQVHRGEPAGE